MASHRVEKYDLLWNKEASALQIELAMIRNGGFVEQKDGTRAGKGLFFHFLAAMELAFPSMVQHKWLRMFVEEYLTHRTIGILGPASSGKTANAAITVLIDYWAHWKSMTVILCSTTKERLEDRLFGEVKKHFRSAKLRYPELPGYLIEGRQRIVSDNRYEAQEGRDFRNGMVGVPCLKGDSLVGLAAFVGIKNANVRLVADELSMLPRAFIDAISNLDKNPNFKAVGLGNPKDTTDALGVFCEPHPDLGGWEGGIDQEPGTKKWATRRPEGVCLQFPGSDSPNLDGKLGIPLITQEQIDRDVAMYGIDSLQYTMMNEGKMPRGQGARRVLTRQMCEKFHAMDEPIWRNSAQTWIAFLDAAYGGVGGDRCIYGELCFGEEATVSIVNNELHLSGLASQSLQNASGRRILYLSRQILVPIKNLSPESPEDQITLFCKRECESRGISPQNFFFDSGMRTSLVSSMARLWSPQVVPLDCGGTPSERKVSGNIDRICKDYYSKFVTELWWSIRLTVEAGQFRGMKEDVLLELCSREWRMVGANKIEIETKPEMKVKTGRSPDLADALAVGIEGARQRGFIIQNLISPAAKKTDERWKKTLRDRAATLNTSGVLDHAA